MRLLETRRVSLRRANSTVTRQHASHAWATVHTLDERKRRDKVPLGVKSLESGAMRQKIEESNEFGVGGRGV